MVKTPNSKNNNLFMHANDSPQRRLGRGRVQSKGEQKVEDNPLIKAARMGDAFGVRMNMDRWKRKPDASGNYALHIAAQANNVDIVQYLAEHEAELKNRDGETPLMVALSANALSSAMILAKYSDFEIDAKGRGLLDHALHGNSLECVQCVVLYFKPPPEQIYLALEEARRLEQTEIAKFLENVMNNIVFLDCGECWKLLQKYSFAITSANKLSEQLRVIEEANSGAQTTDVEEPSVIGSPGIMKNSAPTSSRKRSTSASKRGEPGRSNSVTFSDTVTVMGLELVSSNKDPGLLEQEILDLKARLNKLSVDLDLKNKENESLLIQLQTASEAIKTPKGRLKTKDQEVDQVTRAELDNANAIIYRQQLRIDELEQALAHERTVTITNKESDVDQSPTQIYLDDQSKKKHAKKKKDPKEGLEKDKQISFLQDQLHESEKRCTRLLSELEEAKSKQVSSPHLIPYMQLEKSYKVMQDDLLKQESKTLDMQNTINRLQAELSNKNALLTQARGVIATQKEHMGEIERKLPSKGASQKSSDKRGASPISLYNGTNINVDGDGGISRSLSQGVKQSKVSKSQTSTASIKQKKAKQLPPWRGLTDEPDVDLPSREHQHDHSPGHLYNSHSGADPIHNYSSTPQHMGPLINSAMNSDTGSRNSPTFKSITSPIQSSPLRMSPVLLDIDVDNTRGSPRTSPPRSPPRFSPRVSNNITETPTRSQQMFAQSLLMQDKHGGAVVKVGPSKGFVSSRQQNPHLFSTDTIIETSVDGNSGNCGADTVSILADPSILINSPTRITMPTAGRRAPGSYNQWTSGNSSTGISNISHTEPSFNTPASPPRASTQNTSAPTYASTHTYKPFSDQERSIDVTDFSNPVRNMINSARNISLHSTTPQSVSQVTATHTQTSNMSGHISRIPHPPHQQTVFSFRVGNVLQGPGDDNIYTSYSTPPSAPYSTGYATKQYTSHHGARN